MFTLLKLLLTLIAVRAGQAYPQYSTTACSSDAAVQPTPPAPGPAPGPATASPQLFQDLFTAPTALDRFRRLLVQDGKLLSGPALQDVVVFDFNGALPAPGALGGATKAAVSRIPHNVLLRTRLG